MQVHFQEMDQFIEKANQAADIAGEILRSFYLRELPKGRKEGASPIVTEADLAVEKALRAFLSEHFPTHGIFGEEEGQTEGTSEYEWVLDPIDGTIAFSCGKPVFATLIALCFEGSPILGIIDQPIVRHRWVGATGRATLFNDNIAQTSPCTKIEEARFSTTAPEMFTHDYKSYFQTLKTKSWITSYGGDAYAYGLLASGHIDIIMENGLNYYDIAALLPIILGTDGTACDLGMNAVSFSRSNRKTAKYSILATSNSALERDIKGMLTTTS